MPVDDIKEDLDLQQYFNMLVEFLNSKKYGSITLVMQNGSIVGIDVSEKVRNYNTGKQLKSWLRNRGCLLLLMNGANMR